MEEIGICKSSGVTRVKLDDRYFRPLEVDFLQGDSTKARKKLGWVPEITLEELAEEMVSSELNNRT